MMYDKIVIKNGTIFTHDKTIYNMDLLIKDGLIVKIDHNILEEDCDVIDASGMYVLPGLIDMHCELCEPGLDYRESFETAGYSAIAGGFTGITCNPMTDPVIDNRTVVEYVVNKKCPISVYPYGALTKGNKGEEVTEIGEMQMQGVVAVSDGDCSIQNTLVAKTVFQYASMFDMPIILHCEDRDLSQANGINEGFISTQMGIVGSNTAAESIMVAKYIELAKALNVRIHLCHISTRASVDLIRSAKKQGVKLTAETSPQYFSLTESAVLDYNTYAKVNPPLRTEDDIKAIIGGLKDGTIDVISSDHQPHTVDSKEIEFDLASIGISAFETALSVVHHYLVTPGHIDMEMVVRKMSKNPSDLLTINKSNLTVGSPADVVVFDPEAVYEVDARDFKSKAKHSPYHKMSLKGQVKFTFVDGVKYMN